MNTKGFTLLEMIMYVALFSLLLGGMLPAAYQLLSNAERRTRMAEAQDEAAFMDRKIYWALSEASDVATPAPNVLVVTRANAAGTMTFAGDADAITLARDSDAAVPLNAPAFPVTGASFALQPTTAAAGTVTVRFTIADTPFTFRYTLPHRGLFPAVCTTP